MMLAAHPEIGNVITPIFITCDPLRDTVAEVKDYVKGWFSLSNGFYAPEKWSPSSSLTD
jgi:cytochrome oxidase Cu insertion factor (SCO1/SenC/PrrC family)